MGYDFNKGAKAARIVREELGLGLEGPLEDLLATIEAAGGAHVLVLDLPDDVAGAYLRRPGKPLLFVCGTEALPRQRFTLAHEFGHFRLDHRGVIDKWEAIRTAGGRDPQERQANAFAAEFLAPKQAICSWSAARGQAPLTLSDVVELAYAYGVSAKMMQIRLYTAGCLEDAGLRARLDQEIAEDLHLELAGHLGLEPYADSLTAAAQDLPRIPAALLGTQLGDLLSGRRTPEQIARQTGRDPEEVREALAASGLDQLLPTA